MAPSITASRAFFDPSTCRLPHSPSGQQSNSKISPGTRISKYLKVVSIEGKGLGTVATRNIEPYTLLLSEPPAGIAELDDRDRPKEMDSILTAYRGMSPSTCARFDALHEAPLQLETREMRIWRTNALFWSSKKEDDEARFMAVFLDMSRVNHSCVPNAEYHQDGDGEQMHLTSTKTICAGEEVTICYNDDFYYKTGTERNAVLQYTYDFTCKCRACLDSDFAPISDQRRHMLKQVWYCELYGWPVAPNFSTKISSYEDAISMQANNSLTSKDNHGPPKPVESPKPSALQRAVKLEYDEGLTTVGLIKFMFTSAMAFLLDLKKRGQPPNEFPFGKEFQRNLTLLSTSESFLGKLYPPQDIKQKSRTQGKIDVFGMFNARIKYEAMTAADCLKLISEIMDDELDPLTTRLIDG